MPAFPAARLRRAGISAARVTELQAAYDGMDTWRQGRMRALVASGPASREDHLMPIRGRVASDGSYVTIDPDRLAAFVRDGGGPVVADLTRRATNVQNAAKQKVGKRTRRLERSIVKRAGVDNLGPFVLVVTEGVSYGYWHHEGNSRGWPGNPFLRNALPYGSR